MGNSKRENVDGHINAFVEETGFFIILPSLMSAINLFEENDPDFLAEHNADFWAAAFIISHFEELSSLDLLKREGIMNEDIIKIFKLEKQKKSLLENAEKISSNLINIDYDFYREFISGAAAMIEEKKVFSLGDLEKDDGYWIYELQVENVNNEQDKNAIIQKIDAAISNLRLEEEDEEEWTKIKIVKKFETGKFFNVVFQCFDGDEEDILESVLLLEKFSCRIKTIYNGMNSFSPYKRFVMEVMMGELEIKYEDQIDKKEDFESFIEGKIVEELQDVEKLNPTSRALQYYMLDKEVSLNYVGKLINEYPDCIEAYVLKAGWTVDGEEKLELLEEALAAGERTLDIEKLNKEKSWWENPYAKTYMRAKMLYARELESYSYEKDAIELLWELIVSNQEDVLYARCILAEILIKKKAWFGYQRLRKIYKNERTPIFMYGDFLRNYFVLGKKSKTKRSLHNAYDDFPNPIHQLYNIHDRFDAHTNSTIEAMNESAHALIAELAVHDNRLLDVMSDYLNLHSVFMKIVKQDQKW